MPTTWISSRASRSCCTPSRSRSSRPRPRRRVPSYGRIKGVHTEDSTMKIATYIPGAAQTHNAAIGVVEGDWVIDLNYAYALYLREMKGEERAYALADGRIPRDMIGFLQGG